MSPFGGMGDEKFPDEIQRNLFLYSKSINSENIDLLLLIEDVILLIFLN